MSKEFNIVDTPIVDAIEARDQPGLVKLDDLSLALVGGGQADVAF